MLDRGFVLYAKVLFIRRQLPTAMAPEVIKNTNIKLIHRLTSIDDRQLIGSTMSASGIQLEHVAVYRPGEPNVL